jgi:hypothetical protein|tara:strand:- start:258 stop:359 length:102 start_codon:yes stop_codon:yes gene_type:complete
MLTEDSILAALDALRYNNIFVNPGADMEEISEN